MTVGTGIVTAREAIIREAMTQARIIRDRQHLRAIMRAALATVKLITATAAMINFYI
jgi:3-methyladenine DNA glycosylase Tag